MWYHSFLLKYVLATGIRDIAERFPRTAPVDTAPSPSRPAAPRPTAEYVVLEGNGAARE